MIKILNILEGEVRTEIATDFYIPISLYFPSNKCLTGEMDLYHRFDDNQTMLEVFVNPVSKKIHRIQILGIEKVDNISSRSDFCSLPVFVGDPVIEVDDWGKHHNIDETLLVSYSNKELIVRHCSSKNATYRLVLPHVELLIDDDNRIVGYIFYDIPTDKQKDLEDSIMAVWTRSLAKELLKIRKILSSIISEITEKNRSGYLHLIKEVEDIQGWLNEYQDLFNDSVRSNFLNETREKINGIILESNNCGVGLDIDEEVFRVLNDVMSSESCENTD